MKGMLVVFEGADGAGKTTLMAAVNRYLKLNAIPTVSTREPGGTALGQSIRELLLADAGAFMSTRAQIHMFMATKYQLYQEIINPALAEGKVVLCDRGTLSLLVYQGKHPANRDYAYIKSLVMGDLQTLVPADLTLMLSVDPEVARQRMAGRSDNNWLDHCAADEDAQRRWLYQWMAGDNDPDVWSFTKTMGLADTTQTSADELGYRISEKIRKLYDQQRPHSNTRSLDEQLAYDFGVDLAAGIGSNHPWLHAADPEYRPGPVPYQHDLSEHASGGDRSQVA